MATLVDDAGVLYPTDQELKDKSDMASVESVRDTALGRFKLEMWPSSIDCVMDGLWCMLQSGTRTSV
jgi:hypothetical protein